MRSPTLTPLKQFTDWLGINPWNAAGIDLDSSHVLPQATPTRKNKDGCVCLLEEPYLASPNTWTRLDLIELLSQAERTFKDYAGNFPARYYVEGEEQSYKYKIKFKNSVAQAKTFLPEYGCCNPIQFGTVTLSLVGSATLVKANGGDPLLTFTAQLNVPANTQPNDLRVYFPGQVPNNYNDHRYEIRPIDIVIDNETNVATLSAPAYMFVDPELTKDSQVCLPHTVETYVDTVDVYIINIDSCNSGSFVYTDSNCNGIDCDNLEQNACIRTKLVGGCYYGVPFPTDDNCNRLTPKLTTTSIKYNYLAGKELNNDKGLNEHLSHILFKLAIGLSVCIKNYCECATCLHAKVQYYRQVPKEVTTRDVPPGSENEYQYTLLITKEIMNRLDGSAPPNYGVLQAIREIQDYKCDNVQGSILYR